MTEQLQLRGVPAQTDGSAHDRQNLPERLSRAVFSRAAVVESTVSDEDRTVEVVASTEDIDGHGTIVRQNWRLERFARNPIVLYSHNSWELPIGTASDVRVKDGQLRAKITFSTADLNEQAERVWQNVKAKVIRGVSAGFIPHTIKFEKDEDTDIMVLDDNELLELSVCPVPSNGSALAEMRSLALERQTNPQERVAAPEPTPPPSGSAQPNPEPTEERELPMSENKNDGTKTVEATPTIARALGLPPGSPESEILAAATRCRELELQIMALTDSKSSSEGLGAVREKIAMASRVVELEEKIHRIEAERDEQNFETEIQRGLAEKKISPDDANKERQWFAEDVVAGRGSQAVERLRGRLRAAHPRVQRYSQPNSTAGVKLEFNGKKYSELKPAQKARLANEDPELFRLMKSDHEEAQSA